MGETFERLKQGLGEASAYIQGQPSGVRVHTIEVPHPDVRSIRDRLDMTQQQFCQQFGFSLDTLRNWEQGKRSPTGPARILLQVIDHNPKAVLEVLPH